MGTELTTKTEESTLDRAIEYTPFGETKPIKLSLSIVRANIALPTKSGVHPTNADLIRFMMLCQARELNPWVGDAYLVGYDSQDGAQFSLITAIQALYKRAEANPNFDGIESGVIIMRDKRELVERQGDLVLQGELLVGSWARCWRKDRRLPFYDSLKIETYNKGYSQWKKDPAGMIVKCAEASVLRKAFPTQIGGLYIAQERGMIERGHVESHTQPANERVIGSGVVTGSDLINGKPLAQERSQEAPAPESAKDAKKAEPASETKQAPQETKEPAGETKGAQSETQEPRGEPTEEEKEEIRKAEFADACKEKFAAEHSTIAMCKSQKALDNCMASIDKDDTWTEAERMVARKWVAARRAELKGGK